MLHLHKQGYIHFSNLIVHCLFFMQCEYVRGKLPSLLADGGPCAVTHVIVGRMAIDQPHYHTDGI